MTSYAPVGTWILADKTQFLITASFHPALVLWVEGGTMVGLGVARAPRLELRACTGTSHTYYHTEPRACHTHIITLNHVPVTHIIELYRVCHTHIITLHRVPVTHILSHSTACLSHTYHHTEA